MPSVLGARSLSKSFGVVSALRNVSLEVAAGEVRAVCGGSGAGKSTLVKILTGMDRPDSGTVTVDGAPRTFATPRQAQDLGIALVAQGLSLCPDLSVEDNIWLGSPTVPFLHRRGRLRRLARTALALVGAEHILLDTPVGRLTAGERQLVEIVRVLTRDARVLILDEPTAALAERESDRIFKALLALTRQGKSVIYVTQRPGDVFRICDVVTVLRNGELVGTRPITGLDRATLIELMLGRSVAEMYAEPVSAAGDAALVVEELCVPGRVERFSMSAPKGKIVCVAGQVGSGAAEVIDALAGRAYTASGHILVNGRSLKPGSVVRALAHNVLFISGDRAGEGLFRRLSVLDNLVATRLGNFTIAGILRRAALRSAAGELADKVGVDRGRLRSPANELSDGNQQKLAFGRCLDRAEPGVLVMNEPTRGIDVGSRAEIYRLMRELCAQGYAMVLTSSDLEEIVGLGDIVITMCRGRQVATYTRDDATMHRIVSDITHPTELAAAG